MKPLLIFGLLFFTAINTFAQFDQNKLFYAGKAEKYKRMKNTGTLLTIAGGVLAIVGISKVSNSTTTTTYSGNGYSTTSISPSGETGALMFLAGIAGLGSGIPLWIVGSHAQHKYERKLAGVSVQLNIHQQNKGLTLSYRF